MALSSSTLPYEKAAAGLARVAREFHRGGWLLATSGNLSVVLSHEPLRLAMTPTGVDKGGLEPGQMIEVNGNGELLRGEGRPSAETELHLTVARERAAGAVLHTHSIWSTLLSRRHAASGGLAIRGFEMLKALSGVTSHEHEEWIPIVDNTQDIPSMSRDVAIRLREQPDAHAFLIRDHGLYTWGRDLDEARRHVEALEFLFEVMGRDSARPPRGG